MKPGLAAVSTAMRDGVDLLHDVYLPVRDDRVPVVLLRTPYDRTSPRIGQMVDVERSLERGYGVVVQDIRGRHSSEGVFHPFRQEIEDGYDTVEAIATAPYCTGEVVMVGSSYCGTACWMAAVSAPPHLRAIAPHLCAADVYDEWVYEGGAFQLAFNLFWAVQSIGPDDARRRGLRDDVGKDPIVDSREPWNFAPTVGGRFAEVAGLFEQIPLEGLETERHVPPFYWKWLSESDRSAPFWRAVSAVDRAASIQCPVLSVSGWYQSFLAGACSGYSAVRWNGSTEVAREQTRLVLGPWQNSMPSVENRSAGVVDFGEAAGLDLHECEFEFFDDILGRNAAPRPRVRYFVMGANEWRSAEEWPPHGGRSTVLYLEKGGRLSEDRPTSTASSTSFDSDPEDPLPTTGGNTIPGLPQGPQDHGPLDSRTDLAVFRSEPLTEPLEITGEVRVVLHAECVNGSADWVAMLSYELPDGTVINICDGISRVLNAIGQHVVAVDLHDTAISIDAGTRIHVRVGGSNFPRFDRNPNSGRAPASAAELLPGRQRVHHNRSASSRLEFRSRPRAQS